MTPRVQIAHADQLRAAIGEIEHLKRAGLELARGLSEAIGRRAWKLRPQGAKS